MAIEYVRLSQQAKDQLIGLRRRTGIDHWNVLCRWAFCLSLAEQSVPPVTKISTDSNVEMSWRVFGGRDADLYMALLKERCVRDGLGTDPDVLTQQFRLHLHRGVSYLAADRDLRQINDLVALLVS